MTWGGFCQTRNDPRLVQLTCQTISSDAILEILSDRRSLPRQFLSKVDSVESCVEMGQPNFFSVEGLRGNFLDCQSLQATDWTAGSTTEFYGAESRCKRMQPRDRARRSSPDKAEPDWSILVLELTDLESS